MIAIATIDLVVFHDSNVTTYIRFLRKKITKSIMEIKQCINLGKPVIQCDYYDRDELMFLMQCYKKLLSMGAKLAIYEEGRIISIEMIKNLIESIEGIETDRERIDNFTFDDFE